MSNSLDPDQARLFVGPDLGPNCLQRFSVDRLRVISVCWDAYWKCLSLRDTLDKNMYPQNMLTLINSKKISIWMPSYLRLFVILAY